MRAFAAGFAASCVVALTAPAAAAQAPLPGDRAAWVTFAKGGYLVPEGRSAADMLVALNALLASPDPALRDDVAFGAAERWIVRERLLTADELRRIRDMWLENLTDGVGATGDDRVFKRSFSALCLSLIAARDLATPFMQPSELQGLFDRLLDYYRRERDIRGFDSARGWMHTVAHTADALKFTVRNPALPAGSDVRLLAAVRDKIESADAVFVWGENDRMALALQSAVRRPDADAAALNTWIAAWVEEHRRLWSGGPHVNARQFALVENAKQVLRSLAAALAMEARPTPAGDAARAAALAGLAKMR